MLLLLQSKEINNNLKNQKNLIDNNLVETKIIRYYLECYSDMPDFSLPLYNYENKFCEKVRSRIILSLQNYNFFI